VLGAFEVFACANGSGVLFTIRCRGGTATIRWCCRDLHDGRWFRSARHRIIGVYAWQIAEEGRQLSAALAATELVLRASSTCRSWTDWRRRRRTSLGTPLSTILLIARELEHVVERDSPHADDVKNVREQAQRCATFPGEIDRALEAGEPFDQMSISALIEEVWRRTRNFGVAIDMACRRSAPASRSSRATRQFSTARHRTRSTGT